MVKVRVSLAIVGALFLSVGNAAAGPLVNGDFETGTFAGWTVSVQAGSAGNMFIDVPGSTSPSSGAATAANALGGSFYAVSDQGGPGTYALLQSFTVPVGVPLAVLTFEMFVNDQVLTNGIVHPSGLDYTASPNQHARVDILTAAASPFDTGAGVLANYYLGVDGTQPPHPYTSYSFDITSVVAGGGTYQIRFAEVDNQGNFQLGVDNVDIRLVPEPTTLALFGLGLVGVVAWRRKRAKAA